MRRCLKTVGLLVVRWKSTSNSSGRVGKEAERWEPAKKEDRHRPDDMADADDLLRI